MFPPRLLLPTLSLLITQVINDDAPCHPIHHNSSSPGCQKINLEDDRLRVDTRRVFKRQAGRANLGGCENTQLSQIMQRVLGPLLSRNRSKIGDIAQILQKSVQRATGKSFEIIMGKGDMMIASHQMSESGSCRLRIGEYHTTVYETPIQYDINNVELETFLSNIDFGEKLGGSGYPGQEPFPSLVDSPIQSQSVGNSVQGGQSSSGPEGPASSQQGGRAGADQTGRANLGGCENSQLSQTMQRVMRPLLARNNMRVGDIAKILQSAVQRETGKSFEIIMGRGDMMISSHAMSDSGSCRQRIGEFYTQVYETPVQYDITNLAQEQIMSNIDFGENLGGSGYPGQQPFPHSADLPLSETGRASLTQAAEGDANAQSDASGQADAARALPNDCGNAELGQIMQRVVPPLLARNNMRIGDIARALQRAVQQQTGKSYEIIMGRGDMQVSSHLMTGGSSCRQRIGEYNTQVYETPVQYDITNLAEEQFMSTVDFGEPLGSSGYEGQLLFPRWIYENFYPPNYPPYYPPYYPAVPPVVPLECFSGDLIVETSEGPKQMSELRTGDEVLSIEESVLSFSPIIMFLHRDEELLAEFNVITTANGESVKLTNEHLIYVSDCDPTSVLRLVRAKEVTLDHCLVALQSPHRSLRIARVTNITKWYSEGIFAPLTSTGDIIVNDVLSSCHSNLAVKTLQQSLFTAYRFLSFLLPKEGALPLGLNYLATALDLFIPVKGVLG